MADHVDRVVRQWGTERPDLDVSPMEVFGRLTRLSRLVDTELKRNFTEHDLDAASFDVLATLRRSGPPHLLTPTGLMQSSMVTSGAISQRLDRLEARGLVTRTPSGADRRSRRVALTPEGRALVDRALPTHLAVERRVLSGLDAAQTEALVAALRTVLTALGDDTSGDGEAG
ncbi:MarR family winged helix-turn-helix transcriptional regulator [Kitasatospora sp. NPDC051705]|uniref:MarR family winged helix-turn-helix transcriptional regulator n=1 Tax=Kitasatospora sp. NPDC051705 TaxID=3364057 RepID=UPI00379BB805